MITGLELDFARDFLQSASPTSASSLLPAAIIIPQSSDIPPSDDLAQENFSTASLLTLSSVTSLPTTSILTDSGGPAQTAITTSQSPLNDGSNGLLLDSGLPSATHIGNSTNGTGTLFISSYPTSSSLNTTAFSSTSLLGNGAGQPACRIGISIAVAVFALI